jgi:hypothetical protein
MRAMIVRILVAVLVLGPGSASAQVSQPTADVAKGVQQVWEGEYEAAVLTLDGAVRALAGRPAARGELVRAYLYLGVAYLGLEQPGKAQAAFTGALLVNPKLTLDPKEFSKRTQLAFEATQKEVQETTRTAEAPAPSPAPTAAPTPAASPSPSPRPTPAPPVATATQAGQAPEKKGGGGAKLALILAGGALLVGGGVALAAGGKGGSSGGPSAPPSVVDGVSLTSATPSSGGSASLRLTNGCSFPNCSAALRFDLSVTSASGFSGVYLHLRGRRGGEDCIAAVHDSPAGGFSVGAGQSTTVSVSSVEVRCNPPFTIDSLRVYLESGGTPVLDRTLSYSATLNP